MFCFTFIQEIFSYVNKETLKYSRDTLVGIVQDFMAAMPIISSYNWSCSSEFDVLFVLSRRKMKKLGSYTPIVHMF